MSTEYKIAASKLENLPTIDGQCCVNLSALRNAPTTSMTYPKCCRAASDRARGTLFKSRKLVFLSETLLTMFVLCFAASIIYVIVALGYFRQPEQIQLAPSTSNDTKHSEPEDPDWQALYQLFYQEDLQALTPQLKKLFTVDGNRLKRETQEPCKEDLENCKTVMESMKQIVNIVNNNMAHLQGMLTAKDGDSKSQLFKLVKCLQCKNDSITFIDESGPETDPDDHRDDYHYQSDQAQMEHNVDVVTSLLNDHSSSTDRINQTVARPSAASIFDVGDDARSGRRTAAKPQALPTAADAEVVRETVTKLDRIRKDEAPVQANGIDDVEQTVAARNVTGEPDDGRVTEIENEPVHPSVHPSDQGHAELNAGEEAANARKSQTPSPDTRRPSKGRIIAIDDYQSKGFANFHTSETMKSTQQLQLLPTMSWMPYQVCFYGPPANGGPGKQFPPTQMMYPPTPPTAPYSMPVIQQRMGPQNSGQAPNFVQVHAQSVQFMQPGAGNQRVGPTGPAGPNFPMFPGQMQPSATARGNEKAPYYCTYIPAPTFQFPAIPGVSEYQRSSDGFKEDRMEGDSVENEIDPRKSSMRDHKTICPFNTLRCNDGKRCILRSEWCDGQVDCNDASDETSCSCRDRISKERLCDGYFDCPHGEDELGCLGCSKTLFSCNDWRSRFSRDNCVPLSQRCDGIKQCPNGKDEVDCNILTPSFTEGKSLFTIGYTEGYLHKNYMGQWYPVCSPTDLWTKDACNSEIGSELDEAPKIYMQTVPANVYQGLYIAEMGNETKLIPSCLNSATYVRCPRFPCGTRVSTTQDLLLPDILANERTREEDNVDDILGSARVVGGRASNPDAWPFLVAIYKNGHFYCGGVILSELWVLTAAHCLDEYTGHYFEIQAGLLRQFSFSPMAQTRKARYTIIHPHFIKQDLNNDIAMIKLDDPLRFNRWVRPVCLPDVDLLGAMWRQKPDVNTTCIAIGWGAIKENGPDPDQLREVEVPILKNCKYEIDQHENVICAGYPEGGRDACQGDSGGPLMCKNPYSESQWYVAGIISHGEGCARPFEPGVYTRVSYFREWIREISNDEGLPPLRRSPLTKCPGFSCKGGLGRCLPIEMRCNGMVDCLDGEDELHCLKTQNYPPKRKMNDPGRVMENVKPLENTSTTSESTLTNDSQVTGAISESTSIDVEQITTRTSTAIVSEPSASTTEYFNYISTEASTILPKPPIVFMCSKMLQTIPMSKRCDKVVDCEDGTDELNCTCRDFLFNVKPTSVCDGYIDCDDETDEKNCEICAKDEFYCRETKTCISSAKHCDGVSDCGFTEDERYCFTLSNGQHVHLDAAERPSLRRQGILTRYVNGKWRPTCHFPKMHQNKSTIEVIGQKMCHYFGFAYLESSEPVSVRDSELETIRWSKKNPAFQASLSAASLSDGDKTCPGIKIRCRPVLNSSENAHLIVDAGTGSRDYLWPWIAAIFVDGSYRCSATLLDENWLLSASKCAENVRLDTNYTTAVLGYGPLFRYVDGPHQQISIIDEVQHVNDSVSILLHLKHPVNFTRYVRPLFLEKTIYLPGSNDFCVAVGTDENYETKSIRLRPVLKNCQNCQRCFVNASITECSENEKSEWSGTIFCHGKKGWYPAAAFEDENGPCDFQDTQTLTSIDHINLYLTEALDKDRLSIEPSCDGFRCHIGQCISGSRVCDGIPDCRDQTDEDPEYCRQIREHCDNDVQGCNCLKSELRCRNGKCVDKSAFCDGISDCNDASDEPDICTCAEYLRLTRPERLCDGVRHCLDKTDESPEICNCTANAFQCFTSSGSNTCIPQDFICDGDADCINGDDESECRRLSTSPTNSSDSGEIIHRSYGLWHTECFPKPMTSDDKANELCQSLGYSRGAIGNDTMITTEKPMILEPDNFYMVKLNHFTWITLRDDKPMARLVEADQNCHRAFITCA
ncbi:serine protease nudel [Megalopta genalis]|uniref:serine protease nudel n=1 Tax=Megalopta genalis TaxID=115081 RepID=UPI003FD1AC20